MRPGSSRRTRRPRCLPGDAQRCEMTINVRRLVSNRTRPLRNDRSTHGRLVLLFAVLAAATRLVAQDGQWLVYYGCYSSHGFSPLPQIPAGNVARLKPVWVYQPAGVGSIECTPVVANGVMYVPSGPTSVSALDLKSGKAIWEWTRPIAASVLNLGFPRVNRGVAILDNMVYVGTLDGYLFAPDARACFERLSLHVS